MRKKFVSRPVNNITTFSFPADYFLIFWTVFLVLAKKSFALTNHHFLPNDRQTIGVPLKKKKESLPSRILS